MLLSYFQLFNFIGVSTDDENSNCGTLQSLGPIPGSKSFPHEIYLSTTVVACSVYSEINLIPSSGPTLKSNTEVCVSARARAKSRARDMGYRQGVMKEFGQEVIFIEIFESTSRILNYASDHR